MLDRRARDKHSSLLRKSVNYGQKKFNNIGARVNELKMNKNEVESAFVTSFRHLSDPKVTGYTQGPIL
jgi:hypothetical protein